MAYSHWSLIVTASSSVSTSGVFALSLTSTGETSSSMLNSLVGWDCRIHLGRGVRLLPNKCPVYDIKLSDGEAPVLEIWGMSSIPSLPLLSGPLWPGVVAPDRVLSMGQIEQTMCANKWLMLNCDCYKAILETI